MGAPGEDREPEQIWRQRERPQDEARVSMVLSMWTITPIAHELHIRETIGMKDYHDIIVVTFASLVVYGFPTLLAVLITRAMLWELRRIDRRIDQVREYLHERIDSAADDLLEDIMDVVCHGESDGGDDSGEWWKRGEEPPCPDLRSDDVDSGGDDEMGEWRKMS